MDFGNTIIYVCPSCGKETKKCTFSGVTIRGGESAFYSDGISNENLIYPADLVKCPYCQALFFRSGIKDFKSVSMYEYHTEKLEDIEEPSREDMINALKNNLAKNRKDEKTLRECLWRELNNDVRQGGSVLESDELCFWKDNCASLLILTEKTFEEIEPEEENRKDYDDYYNFNELYDEKDSCLFMIAELKRNLGKFEEAAEIIEKLSSEWDWAKEQFARECKAKNIYTFELSA